MKKLLLISILTFVLALAVASPLSALRVDSDGITWYDVSELLEYKKHVDQEFGEACGSDFLCIKSLHAEKFKNDEKYAALYTLEARNFLITEINHHTRKFKILFFDERLSVKKELGLKTNKLVLKDLYVSWLDNTGVEREIFDGLSRTPDLYYNNQIPGVHLMVGHRGDVDGYDWFFDYNTEAEYRMVDEALSDNNVGTLKYKAQAISGYSGSGAIGYSPCLNSPQYREETGCVLRVSKEKGPIFFPVGPVDGESDELKNSDELTGSSEQSNELLGETNNTGSNSNANNIDSSLKLDDQLVSRQEVDNTALVIGSREVGDRALQAPRTPNTGDNTRPCISKTIEFPWWIIGLILLGDAVILWLFWPNRQKNHKKS